MAKISFMQNMAFGMLINNACSSSSIKRGNRKVDSGKVRKLDYGRVRTVKILLARFSHGIVP